MYFRLISLFCLKTTHPSVQDLVEDGCKLVKDGIREITMGGKIVKYEKGWVRVDIIYLSQFYQNPQTFGKPTFITSKLSLGNIYTTPLSENIKLSSSH